MEIDSLFAACNLEGLKLKDWVVKKKIPKPEGSKDETGSNFSICYIVEKDGEECFMKVLDNRISAFGDIPNNMSRREYVQVCYSYFNYEKRISRYCSDRRIKNVLLYKDEGDIKVEGFLFSDVSYIIYEKADGDIRRVLSLSNKCVFTQKLKSISQKLKSLHDIAVGIQQLHTNEISHQDIKPSNILSFGDGQISKIGDLGRALCLNPDISSPFNTENFNGDANYAPPEVIFGYDLPDVKERLYQIDNYMFGSLIVFYICGISFNALMNKFLSQDLLTLASRGTYDQAKSYLINAFAEALRSFEESIPINEIKDKLVKIVEYLCNPIVEKRGHPKIQNTRTPNYDLIRTYTELDMLYRKAQIMLIKNKDGGNNK